MGEVEGVVEMDSTWTVSAPLEYFFLHGAYPSFIDMYKTFQNQTTDFVFGRHNLCTTDNELKSPM